MTSFLLPVAGDPVLHVALYRPGSPPRAEHWTRRSDGTTRRMTSFPEDSRRVELVRSPASPTRLFAAISTRPSAQGQSRFQGIWMRAAGGVPWRRVDGAGTLSSPCNDYCDYCLALAARTGEAGGEELFFGAIAPWRSTDAGVRRDSLPSSSGGSSPRLPFRDIHRLRLTGNGPSAALWAATDGGIWRLALADLAAGWQPRNGDLRTTQIYHLRVDPHRGDRVVAAAQDRGVFLARPGAPSLPFVDFDGVCTDADPRAPGVWFFAERATGIFRFAEARPTPVPLARTPSSRTTATRRAYFVADGCAPGLLAGARSVWWARDAAGAPPDSIELSGQFGPTAVVSAVSQSPVDRERIWVRLDDGRVYVTEAARAAEPPARRFREVTGNLPRRAVSSLVAHPSDRTRAWVTFALAAWSRGDTRGNVWAADDDQGRWHDISTPGGEPRTAANHLLALTGDGAVLLLATDHGLYASRREGCWLPFGSGMPRVSVSWLDRDEARGVVQAATYGRGLWQLVHPRPSDLALDCPGAPKP